MRLDWDGKIRMDCSSPYAMAGLIQLKERFDIAFGNDTDFDRHGIVTRSAGLLNPNHYLAVAIHYLFQHRPGWRADAAVGKTLVSSAMIDRVAAHLGRRLVETPVASAGFVDGLLTGTFGFGGEESAGASFLRRDGNGLEHLIKTASSSTCWPPKSPRSSARTRRALPRVGGAVRQSGLRAHRCARERRAEGALAGGLHPSR